VLSEVDLIVDLLPQPESTHQSCLLPSRLPSLQLLPILPNRRLLENDEGVLALAVQLMIALLVKKEECDVTDVVHIVSYFATF
jgi:hypothetical protein